MGGLGAAEELSGVVRGLERCADDRFGSLIGKLPCHFRPQPLVERGEWWTDWCLDIAKIARCDPRPLAEELVDSAIKSSDQGAEGIALRATEGYLVVSCRELPAPSPVVLPKRQRVVVVSPAVTGTNRWLTMRTAAAAAVQAHLAAMAGETVEVWLGDEQRLVCESRCSGEQLKELLSWVWRGRAHSALQVRSRVEQLCTEAQRSNVAVALWCLPATISHTTFRRWYLRRSESGDGECSRGSDEGSFTLCCPSGGWFIDPPHHHLDWRILEGAKDVEESVEKLWGLALHLAGGQSARDIDQYVGRFAEFDSLPWSIRAATDRLGRSGLVPSDAERYAVSHGVSRAALLSSAFYRDAVIFGTVPLFVDTMREVARDAHRMGSFPPRSDRVASADEAPMRELLSAVCRHLSSLFTRSDRR